MFIGSSNVAGAAKGDAEGGRWANLPMQSGSCEQVTTCNHMQPHSTPLLAWTSGLSPRRRLRKRGTCDFRVLLIDTRDLSSIMGLPREERGAISRRKCWRSSMPCGAEYLKCLGGQGRCCVMRSRVLKAPGEQ